MKMTQKKPSTCIFCNRMMSDHTNDQHYDCALELCNKMVVASSASGTGDQLNEKIHGYAPNGVSS